LLAPTGVSVSPTDRSDSSGQGRLFEHLLGLLTRLSERRLVVLVIEDLHWVDRTTLPFLSFIVRNLRQASFMLLRTYRAAELDRHAPLLPFLGEQERSGRAVRLELGRFGRTELGQMLAAILGAEPSVDRVEPIFTRSGGNAFYAEELLGADGSDVEL